MRWLLSWLRGRRRSFAIIRQYDNVALWFIEPHGPLPNPVKAPDWSTCPGTLHQDFDSPHAAIETAHWWGYKVIVCRGPGA